MLADSAEAEVEGSYDDENDGEGITLGKRNNETEQSIEKNEYAVKGF